MINLYPIMRPFIFMMDPEKAHNFSINALRRGLTPVFFPPNDDDILKTEVFGLGFSNPVGLAAGYDKNAEVADGLIKLGFGFVEVGTVTPEPQEGNPKPRLFRLSEDRAVLNRFGFNSEGVEIFAARLGARRNQTGIVGANVGANKLSPDRTEDYVSCIKRLGNTPSYFTVNISSPNTPGLRTLQDREALEDLLSRVVKARDSAGHTPILLKIAPDLTDEDKHDIAEAVMNAKIDGIIVSNTTIERPTNLQSKHAREAGGLSGAPLTERSTEVLSEIYKLTQGKMPLIGVGGISNGADAYAKIRAGASLVQVYSMMVYEGPAMVTKIKQELAGLLRRDGFSSLSEAVGADHV